MRVLVTGGSGFIGTNLVQKLIDGKHDVLNIDQSQPKLQLHQAVWRQVSLLNEDKILRAVSEFRPEYVIHAAARTDLGGRNAQDYKVNTVGTSNVIQAIKSVGSVKRTAFLSSMLVCRNGYTPKYETEYCPDTIYGESKAEMEKIVRSNMNSKELEYVLLRPTSIWGPWFGAPYLHFFYAIRRGLYVHPGNITVRKHFGYVGNVVNQILSFLKADIAVGTGKMYNVGDYEEYVVRDWANLIQRELRARRIYTVPLPVMQVTAAMGDILSSFGLRRFPLTSFRLHNMLTSNHLPFEATSRFCGELEYSISDGVRLTVEWIGKQNM